MCFRGTRKNHLFSLAPHLCRASRVPTYAQLWTCRGFAMLLSKLRLERLENSPSPPRTPFFRPPPCNSALSLSPHLTEVTYSSAFQFPRCGDLGGVGRGERCVCGDIGAPLEERGQSPPRSSSLPAWHRVPRFLPFWAAVGHSRRGAHPSKFPLGIQSPRGRDTDLSGTRNLRFGKLGSSLGFSRQKGFSRIFPRFLIIF